MDGRIGIKGGVKSQTIPNPGEGTWYISDGIRILGPMSWRDVMGMTTRGDVTQYAHVWEQNWTQWMPIGMYFRVKTKDEIEAEALMPSRYDALFWFGVFVFFIGVVMLFDSPVLGVTIVMISALIEIFALYLESKYMQKAVARSLGNAIAIVWIVLQVLITGFFVSLTT